MKCGLAIPTAQSEEEVLGEAVGGSGLSSCWQQSLFTISLSIATSSGVDLPTARHLTRPSRSHRNTYAQSLDIKQL